MDLDEIVEEHARLWANSGAGDKKIVDEQMKTALSDKKLGAARYAAYYHAYERKKHEHYKAIQTDR